MSVVETPAATAADMAGSSRGRGFAGAVIGVLIGFKDEGRTPLVIFPSQPGDAAVAARATVDVHGSHIGREVALIFEEADPRRPIIVGLLQRADGAPLMPPSGQVSVDADGERLIVSARDRLVLRCGNASITLTKSGKILIEGAYVSSSASGVNRVTGSSIQLN
jgi:Domain of unknown function (DUF6484)